MNLTECSALVFLALVACGGSAPRVPSLRAGPGLLGCAGAVRRHGALGAGFLDVRSCRNWWCRRRGALGPGPACGAAAGVARSHRAARSSTTSSTSRRGRASGCLSGAPAASTCSTPRRARSRGSMASRPKSARWRQEADVRPERRDGRRGLRLRRQPRQQRSLPGRDEHAQGVAVHEARGSDRRSGVRRLLQGGLGHDAAGAVAHRPRRLEPGSAQGEDDREDRRRARGLRRRRGARRLLHQPRGQGEDAGDRRQDATR